MKRISFVVLHYGDLQVTERCIQSIFRMEHQEQIRIIIVDNEINKTDKERLILQQKYEGYNQVYVIKTCENGGFSYANNIGYAYARDELHSDFILILNNDIEFLQQDFIKQLERSYHDNPCHVLGPDIIHAGTNVHQNPMDTRIRTKEEAEYTIRMNEFALKWYSLLYPILYWQRKNAEKKNLKDKKGDYYNSIQQDIVPFGACLVFTPLFVYKESKAFEPETMFYYEEYILALRCQMKKYDIIYDPRMKLLHENGIATKKCYKSERKRIKFMMQRILESCQIYYQYLNSLNNKE